MNKATFLRTSAWGLAALVSIVSVYVWGDLYKWDFENFTSYQLFPLFGLLAFGLMWSHYIIAALRKYLQQERGLIKDYLKVTSLAVLAFLLLHPAIIIAQLYADGFGLPPGSYKMYVGASLAWVVLLGMVSLLVFLSYELHRFYKTRSWWKYVSYASDVAMLAILYHGFKLGSHIQTGWFRGVWIFFAISYAGSLVYAKFLPATSDRK